MRAPLDLLDLTLGSDDLTNARTRSLSRDRWNDPVVELHTEGLSLPFLRDGDSEMPRWLEVTKVEPHLRFADHQIDCDLGLAVNLGSIRAEGAVRMIFDWEQFAFRIQPGTSFDLAVPPGTGPFHGDFLGLDWTFTPAPDHRLFTLDLAQRAFAVKQAPGSELAVKFTRATAPGQGIEMDVTGFAMGPGGVSLKAAIKPTSAKFLGVDTFFRLDAGSFEIKDNRIADFVLEGSGDLPPALVGDARAKVKLHFGQRDGRGPLRVLSASAELLGKPRLICEGTRFNISVDAFGLEYVDDGAHQHFYFTITGTARYTPLAGDDAQGPLAWLPRIEMRLLNAPLCGDPTVLRNHIQFLVEMPHKPSFALLGCFSFELRAIAFEPRTKVFDPITDAMRVSGQVKFSDAGGDAIEVKIDFHNLYIGLPEPGHFLPRLHLKGLGVKVRSGDAFELAGEVDFLEGQIEPGVSGDGFAGVGHPAHPGAADHRRGLHLRAGARPRPARARVVPLRRSAADEFADPGFADLDPGDRARVWLPLHACDDPHGRRGGRSARAAADPFRAIADPGQPLAARPVAARPGRRRRALHDCAARAHRGGERGENVERLEQGRRSSILPCLAMMDAVIALRSDLTFLMTARGWLFTNYYDFLTRDDIKDHPLISGFVYLSPKRRRFLAHVESHPGAAFGDHPPIPFFLKEAIRQSRFSATLLVEPGLFHAELGWPNGLQWRLKLGPLLAEFMGGMITRVSTREFVQGTSFIAHGRLDIRAGIDLGFVGASSRWWRMCASARGTSSSLGSINPAKARSTARSGSRFACRSRSISGSSSVSSLAQSRCTSDSRSRSNLPRCSRRRWRAMAPASVPPARSPCNSWASRSGCGYRWGSMAARSTARRISPNRTCTSGWKPRRWSRSPANNRLTRWRPPAPFAPARRRRATRPRGARGRRGGGTGSAATAPTGRCRLRRAGVRSGHARGRRRFPVHLAAAKSGANPAAGANQPMPFLPPPPDTPEGFADPDLVWAAPAGGFGQLQRWSAGGGWTNVTAPEVQIHCEWTEPMGEGLDKNGTGPSVNLAKWLRQSYIQESSYPRSNPHALDLQRLADDLRDHRVGAPRSWLL